MPLRKWMTIHGHPGWYSWLVVIGGCLVSMVVSVAISIRASDAALERDRMQREQSEHAEQVRRAEGRAASCSMIRRVNRAYASQRDELSPAGQDIAQAWADLAKLCR